MTFDDKLFEAADLAKAAEQIAEILRNAESVETESDFDANIKEALTEIGVLVRGLNALHPKKGR